MRPYGDYAESYLEAGFAPIPARGKRTIKNQHHGKGKPWVTSEEVRKWSRLHPDANIAARLPRDVIGIDVDAYGDKPGEESLAELEDNLGQLPATVISTSRLDGISGIRLFRLPDRYWSVIWPGKAGPGIDIIWHGNRYAIAWPSVHPDTGETYLWHDQYDDGTLEPIDGIPDLSVVPSLPKDWCEYFAKRDNGDEQSDVSDTAEWINSYGGGEMCGQMAENVARAELTMPDGAHDSARDGTLAVAKDTAAGHRGGRKAMDAILRAFREAMGDRGSARRAGASSEWRRHYDGAVRRGAAVLEKADGVQPGDPCEELADIKGMRPLKNYGKLLEGTRNGAWLHKQKFPPLRWAVPHILPEGLVVLAGPPKAGKSVLMLMTSLACAKGWPIFGEQTEQRPVFYLALEDGDRRLQTRCRQLIGDRPIPESFEYKLTVRPGKLIVTVEAWISSHRNGIVLVDTLGRALERPQQGETTYDRDYRIVVALKAIADGNPGSVVCVSHHSRKSSGRSDDFLEMVSGTNAITGAADTIIVLTRKRGGSDGVMRVAGRDVEEAEYAVILERPSGWKLDGDSFLDAARTALQRETSFSDRTNAVVELVENNPDGIRAGSVARIIGISETQATTYLNRLVQSGNITKITRGLFAPNRKIKVGR